MTEHQLFVFLLDVTLLFLAARVGGELAARVGIPLHVGELLVGMTLGPSLLGWLWPRAFTAVFPADVLQRSVLEIVSWTGIIFLVLLGGLETNLGVLRRAGKIVAGAWIGGFGLPFVGGFLLGLAFPSSLVPAGIDKPVFALFLATAMSISAIPVIARILMDLRLYRTRVGMVILSTAIADDTIGWIVLAIVAGLASGGVAVGAVSRTIGFTIGFVGLAVVAGRALVRAAMAFSRRLKVAYAEISMVMLLVFGLGAATQAIGVHLVLGAFVASILIGQVGEISAETHDAIRHIGLGFFIPFFFAYTGIKVDLTTLHGSAMAFTALAVLVACASKVIGGGLGARAGGLPSWEALAVGFGLNARGAMELVIAAIGLSIGILTEPTYAMIVLIAVLTTVMAAPLLRICVRKAGVEPEDEPTTLSAPVSQPA